MHDGNKAVRKGKTRIGKWALSPKAGKSFFKFFIFPRLLLPQKTEQPLRLQTTKMSDDKIKYKRKMVAAVIIQVRES